MRYSDDKLAEKYSSSPDYFTYNKDAVQEMFRQAEPAIFDRHGIIKKGLIIRHLVLPNNLAGTEIILAFIAKELSTGVHISLMSQYHPCFEADRYPELDRRITLEEYEDAISLMKKYSLENGWVQESYGLARFAGTNIKRNI